METNKLDPEFVRTLCERLKARSEELASKEPLSDEEIVEIVANEDVWHLLQQTSDVNKIRSYLNECISATTLCTGTYTKDSAVDKLSKKNTSLDFFHWWRHIHLEAKHFFIKLQTEISIYEVTHASL